jgi:opacity protein-like surface antigen
MVAAPAARAAADLGLKSIGASVGMVSPENLGSTFGLGASADWGTIAPDVGLESRLDYWSKSESSFGFESSVRDIDLSVRAKYNFQLESNPIRPFAGGGLGIHFLRSEVTTPVFFGIPGMTSSASDTKIGLELGGGFATAVSPRSDLVGEAWYGIVSDVSQLSLRFGMTYKLGQ